MAGFRIPEPFVRAPLSGARKHGLTREALLQRAGITESDFAADGSLGQQEYARLMFSIWQASDDEVMGLSPEPVLFGTFAMMCRAVIHCTTLEHALRRASAFYRLIPHAPQLHLEQDEHLARIVVTQDMTSDPDHFLSESLLAIWHRFSSWLVGHGIPLLQVRCPYAIPVHRDLYSVVFATPVEFSSSELSLILPARELSSPVTQTPASLRQFLKHSPADVLARPNPHQSMTGRIRNYLRQHDCAALPDLDDMARTLSTSSPTLRRRLKEEQTSFQQLKDEIRRDEATRLLAESPIRIADIASRLGYTETSTFQRAFRKWTGQTPGQYRARNRSMS